MPSCYLIGCPGYWWCWALGADIWTPKAKQAKHQRENTQRYIESKRNETHNQREKERERNITIKERKKKEKENTIR